MKKVVKHWPKLSNDWLPENVRYVGSLDENKNTIPAGHGAVLPVSPEYRETPDRPSPANCNVLTVENA